MSFPTDWDVDKYRVDYESMEHWELRKKFLETHKNKYPEDKLVCLAQVFYNVEFLGCRYPKATMNAVEKLSKGIIDDHREKKKNCLKRTFVGASDAASSKVKGMKRTAAALLDFDKKPSTSNTTVTPNIQLMQSKFIKFESAAPVATTNEIIEPSPAKKKKKKKKKSATNTTPSIVCPPSTAHSVMRPPSTTPSVVCPPSPEVVTSHPSGTFKDVILYYQEPHSFKEKLSTTSSFNRLNYELSTELSTEPSENPVNHKSSVKLFDKIIGVGTGSTIAFSQEAAAKAAITFLEKQCYTIVVKNQIVVERKIQRNEIISGTNQPQEDEVVKDEKASRMMKMMGWAGGGLGKEEQGRTEPVVAVQQSRRAGVGSTLSKIKFKVLKNILEQFMKSGSTHDIVFSTDFDNAERKEIHSLAHRLGLKSLSRAKGDNRFLTVSKKWMPHVLLSVLKDSRNKSEKYQLLPPNPEAVTEEKQRQQTEELNLRDREKEITETDAIQKRARLDEDVNIREYVKLLEDTKKEMSVKRKAAVVTEMNQKLLAAARDLVAKKELELAELRRNKQWASQAEGGSAVNASIKNQIAVDLEQMTKRVKDARKELVALAAKRAEASQIIRELRAYILTEKNAQLEMERRVKAMSVEHRKQTEVGIASRHQQIRFRHVAPSPIDITRLSILKELQEERMRGGKLTKDLSELTLRAVEKANERKNWMEEHFPENFRATTDEPVV